MNHPIVAADANDLVQETAAKDAAGWLARMTRNRFSDARELGTADLIGSGLATGDELTGDLISAAQARRPFSPAQRKAPLIRDKTCRAEACDVPGTWAEAHHLDPWHTGGRTDLDRGVLLCSHHHHRAHDTAFRTDRMPHGDMRFHRRR